MNGSKILVGFFIAALILVVLGGGLLIYYIQLRPADPELMMGLLVVVSIATLMSVLFVVAAGFNSMNLTDPRQALGLPEGSIRAMIALVLIMVFIIFGIFLFRKVGVSNSTYLGIVTSPTDAKVPPGSLVIFAPRAVKTEGYDVFLIEKTTEEGQRLAQQLLTTVGTLVVSIASFYFGSTMATAAAKKASEEIASPNPVVKDITPKEGAKGQEVPIEIVGTDFKTPRLVQLRRGGEVMVGTGVTSTATKIQCKVMIDKEPDGKWNVVVENEDGKQGQLAEIFVIKRT